MGRRPTIPEEPRYCLDCLEEVKQGRMNENELVPLPIRETNGNHRSTKKYCDAHGNIRRSKAASDGRKKKHQRVVANLPILDWDHRKGGFVEDVEIDPLDI